MVCAYLRVQINERRFEMRLRRIGLWIAALALSGCGSHQITIEPDPAVYDTGRASSTTDVPTGAKASTSNPNASTAARLGIPPGHLPDPGECRVWIPGESPGKQKKNAQGDCSWVASQVPPGGWLVWRPGTDRKEVVVREYGSGSILHWTRIYDIVTGVLLHEEAHGD
jgi:hypothetical protein